MTEIFISYARKYEPFARKLSNSLRAQGYGTWLDVESIPSGKKWSTAIQEGLIACEVLIVLITPEAMASTNVEDEWQYFLDNKKPVFPILVQPAKIHFQLNRIQYIDFHSLEYETAFARLSQELTRELSNTPSADAPAVEAPSPQPKPADTAPTAEDLFGEPLAWVQVPAGEVILGDVRHMYPAGTQGGRVAVAAFFVTQCPITEAQFAAFVGEADGYHNTEWWTDDTRAHMRKGRSATVAEGDPLPVTGVNWYEATAFCRWLSYRTGIECALPTEAQWQRAAQGDSGLSYPWGDRFDPAACHHDAEEIASVLAYPTDESPFGVVGMAGNIKEWCADAWGQPADGEAAAYRCVRGGSRYDYAPAAFAATKRSRNRAGFRSTTLGFRVVCRP